ncbi:hypothetical protein K7B07_15235 [Niabella sp. 3A5MI-3]|nr:hypothetical protein [Niabella beijingensis]
MGLSGLGFIMIPQIFGTGAVPPDPSPELLTYLRVFGSPLLGIAVLDWMARNEPSSSARNAIIIGNIVGFGTIALLDIWGLLHEARPATWVFVVIHLFFTLSFIVIGRKAIYKRQ